MTKSKLLASVCPLVVAAIGIAGTAGAQVTTQTYGSGNTLFAPYLRQAEDCYGNPTALVVQGPNTHSPTTINITPFNYLGTPAFNCATTHVDSTVQLNTIETSSGTGIKALFSHDPVTFWGDTVPPGGNNTPYPTVNWATSETVLGATDVAVYNSGGTEQTITFGPGKQYPVPQPLYGALIQFPMAITPIVMAYDSVYKKIRNADNSVTSYHFRIHRPRSDGSGGLVLNAAEYCGIFNGQITNWNDPALQALNGGVSLKDPADPDSNFSVPLTMVGRSDSAGATSTWTRHLAAECPLVISGNQYADSTTTLPAALQGPSWNKTNPNFGPGSGVTDVPGKYTLAAGADGVADYIQFDPTNLPGPSAGNEVVQGRMGYDGADEVLPAVVSTGDNTFGLQSASILRAVGAAPISPTAKSALLAYAANITPPTGANESHPDLWVQPDSKTAAVAIPANLKAYPIVGTSNFIGYTCYSQANVAKSLAAYLFWFESSKVVNSITLGNLDAAGSAAMPLVWLNAIEHTFLKPTSSLKPLNLYILQAGTGPATGTGSQCKAITPGG